MDTLSGQKEAAFCGDGVGTVPMIPLPHFYNTDLMGDLWQ